MSLSVSNIDSGAVSATDVAFKQTYNSYLAKDGFLTAIKNAEKAAVAAGTKYETSYKSQLTTSQLSSISNDILYKTLYDAVSDYASSHYKELLAAHKSTNKGKTTTKHESSHASIKKQAIADTEKYATSEAKNLGLTLTSAQNQALNALITKIISGLA